jgi:hypothetical protein
MEARASLVSALVHWRPTLETGPAPSRERGKLGGGRLNAQWLGALVGSATLAERQITGTLERAGLSSRGKKADPPAFDETMRYLMMKSAEVADGRESVEEKLKL